MNCQELFNLRHSSLRTTIERVFGVVKNRFPILRMPHGYSLTTQQDIVIACCTLHNHIVMHSAGDPMLETISIGTNSRIDPPLTSTRNIETVPRWNRNTWHSFRDSITEQMWNDYVHQQEDNHKMECYFFVFTLLHCSLTNNVWFWMLTM